MRAASSTVLPLLLPAVLLAVLLTTSCGDLGLAFPDGGGAWPVRPAPAWSGQSRLAITLELGDAVALVTPGEAPALLGTFAVGDDPIRVEAPHHLAVAPDGQTLYVNLSNYAPGSGTGPSGSVGIGATRGQLLKLRASDGTRLGAAPLDRNSGDLVLSQGGRTAYVSHYDLLKVQDALTRGRPASEAWSTIAIVDTTTMAAPELLPVCPTAHGLALSADERTLYVACSLADELAIVYGDWLPDGKTLLLPHQGDEQVSFIDTSTGRETHRIALPDKACLRPHMLRVSPDPTLGWLVCEGDHVARPGTLVTLDLAARAVLGFVEVGLYPDALVLLPAAK